MEKKTEDVRRLRRRERGTNEQLSSLWGCRGCGRERARALA